MRTDELVTAVRLSSFLPDAHADFTTARIQLELNDIMLEVFGAAVVGARGGYWLKTATTTLTASKNVYRIPARATVGGLEAVELAQGTSQFVKLVQVAPEEAALYAGPTGTTGTPSRFYVRGDQIVLLPTPDSGSYTLRFHYYVRPSRLVTQQSSTLGSGTIRGQITAINTAARTLTVNVVPFDQELGTPAAITSALQRIDVVHPDGWHELALVGATQTLAGSVFTVGGSDSFDEIVVGDFVRSAEQTDWPCLPDEFHRTLADAAACVALTSVGAADKAAFISGKVTADVQRLASLIEPRIKSSVPKLKPTYSFLRGGNMRSIPPRFP